MKKLQDTLAIEEFMKAFGQPVRDTPINNPGEDERLLRGILPLEEVFELLAALGLKFAVDEDSEPVAVDPKKVRVTIDEDATYDPVETLDALVDIVVVAKGGGSQLGLPIDDCLLDEVAPSNMSKMGEDSDGNPVALYREDGKILKGPNFFSPDVPRALRKAGWSENSE